jgi:triacylglycerol lipase
LCGYSAGGHLSALVATLADEPMDVRSLASHWASNDSRWSKLPKIKAICVGGPPCDFQGLPIDNTTMAYFLGGSRRDKSETYMAASPIAHVSAADPITQIIQGEADVLVPIAGSRAFHEAQRSAGVDSRFMVIEKQGHMLTFLNPRTGQTMVDFFQEVLFDQSDEAGLSETP